MPFAADVNEKPFNLTVDNTAVSNMVYSQTAATRFEVYVPEHVNQKDVLTFSVLDPDFLNKAPVSTWSK